MFAALVLMTLAISAQPDPDLGRQIYLQGILPSGQSLTGTTVGDVELEGAPAACAACHRRSGFGTGEGGAYVPPITAPSLFGDDLPERQDLFRKLYQEIQPSRVSARVRDGRFRPPYTQATLAAALRDGRDPTGRELDPVMPRYVVSDVDMRHLAAYLQSLGDGDDPGVDDSTIHLATFIAGDVAPDERRAMLEVMRAYFERKNADTAGQLQRPGHSPMHKDDFYDALRRWQLHVWEVDGPRERWRERLEAYYRQRPVFAVLAGLGEGDWSPVHDFCEGAGVPCLFPNTDEPPVSEAGAYALYLSRGLTVEAEALARHLRQGEAPARVVQVYRGPGSAAARALRHSLPDGKSARLEDSELGEADEPGAAFWARLMRQEPSALVLWLADPDLEPLAVSPGIERVERLFLSYSLLGDAVPRVPESLRDKVRLTYRYALPGREPPRIYRVRGWMRSRGIARDHERLRLNTYFALSIADHALMHLVESFSRDYFVEAVEHEAENALNPGVFPRLSLGPGQRFASKGAYVVRLTDGGIEAVTDWIVP